MAMDLYYYYGDCTTPDAQAQIRQNFIQILNESSFNAVCRDTALQDKCKADNVVVTCSLVDSVNVRRRREVGMFKIRWRREDIRGGGSTFRKFKILLEELPVTFALRKGKI